MNVGGGGTVESLRHFAALDHGVVAHHRATADNAVEQHRVKADEYVVADDTRAVHNRAMRDRSVFADFHQAAGFGVNHHAVLNIGIGADDDGFHATLRIDLVGADNGIGPDKYILADDDFAADNGGGVDESGFGDDRQIAAGIFSNHRFVFTRCAVRRWVAPCGIGERCVLGKCGTLRSRAWDKAFRSVAFWRGKCGRRRYR